MREKDREKFVRLANARVNRAIEAIRLVGNLSNRSNYAYLQEDVDKIFRSLSAELKICRQRFDYSKKAASDTFTLS